MSAPNGNCRVLVVGGGAIGGTVAGHLLHSGVDTWGLVTNPKIFAAVGAHGYRHRGHTPLSHVPNPRLVASPEALEGSFDYILLALQPPQVEGAVPALLDHLAPGGRIVCFQNGLCEQRVARLVPAEQIIGAIVTWGASMPEPGVFDRTSEGGFVLGRLDGRTDEAMRRLGDMLSCVGPVELSDNLLGARWAKLAGNCAISTLGTLSGGPVSSLLRRPFARMLALEIISEALEVAQAEGVRVVPLAGNLDLTWLRLDRSAFGRYKPRRLVQHAGLLLLGYRYRRLRSSMLSAMERGRPPAVDFLNGEVVSHGKEVSVPTPVNALAQQYVWDIAKGRATSSVETVRRLYDVSRYGLDQG